MPSEREGSSTVWHGMLHVRIHTSMGLHMQQGRGWGPFPRRQKEREQGAGIAEGRHTGDTARGEQLSADCPQALAAFAFLLEFVSPPRKISPDTWAVCLSFGNCCNNQTLTGWGRPGTLLASCIDNLDNTKDHDKTAPRGILSGMVFQVLGSWSFRVMRHRKSAQPISLSPGLFPVGLS